MWSVTMDEFRRKPVNRLPEQPTTPTAEQVPPIYPVHNEPERPFVVQPVEAAPGLTPVSPKKPRKKLLIWGSIGVLLSALLLIGALFVWYQVQLSPVNSGDTTLKVVKVESGSTPTQIADLLEDEGVIRSSTAFLWYTRLQGVQSALQAGAYRISPSETTPEVVEHLVSGKVDMINVTLFPGATLTDTTDKEEAKKYDVTTALKRAGYTDEEIAAGLSADYSEYAETLFQGRPSGADLEGYVYGETYRVSSDSTVEDILRTSFDHLWQVIQENDLVARYAAQGLSLYEGLTLASIVQREAGSTPDDMAQISQVFHTRLAIGMPLGSDPTYQYIADKTGVPRSTTIDSPYNTRRYPGLPPGPIAASGEKALVATANPAQGDYLYFLSGDDDVTYFARTLQEHEQNIVNHCQQKCQIL